MCRKYFPVLSLIILFPLLAASQDTLRIDLRQADSLFVNRNYYLLAASMNIEAQKAQELQARLYPNPVATADLNVYDPENRKALHAGSSGQKYFQLEQLFLLGGKRKAEIALAKTNTAIAALEFQNLVRQLRYQLHFNLYAVGQQKILLGSYNQQLHLLDSLVSSTQVQADKGNVPVKDLVRLKGAYLKLNNDRAEIYKAYYQSQTALNTILQTQVTVDFAFEEKDIQAYIKPVGFGELQELALANRPDMLLEQKNNDLAVQYHEYQKKLAVPDLNVFVTYDQRSGAFGNQVNAGVALPLPLWNKNQGNIKTARHRIRQSEYQVEAVRNNILSEIKNTHSYYRQTVSEYFKATGLYDSYFEITLRGMTDNFRKRNVSIIEFIDFFEAYNEVLTELVRIRIQLVESGELLNLLTGKDLY